MSRILIVEDESRIASFLQKGFRANAFSTTVASDGDEALALARSGEFDLMILDLGLPQRDGFEVLRELRHHDNQMPVIILTSRTGVKDTVAGLEGGADDYVPKPFRFQELLARVRLRLRDEGDRGEYLLRAGDASLDLRTRRLHVHGQSLELTAREFGLAEVFFRHPGQVLTREQLLSHVWGYDHDPGSNVVDVYVGYLRKKLGDDRITTLRGMGYRLEEQPSSEEAPHMERQHLGEIPRRILVIEDDGPTAQTISKGLVALGEVVVAEDADVGLYLAMTERFDVAILDLEVPGPPGLRVMEVLREERPEVPLIVVGTAGRLRGRSIPEGATAFLSRPFSVNELKGLVKASLSVAGPSADS